MRITNVDASSPGRQFSNRVPPPDTIILLFRFIFHFFNDVMQRVFLTLFFVVCWLRSICYITLNATAHIFTSTELYNIPTVYTFIRVYVMYLQHEKHFLFLSFFLSGQDLKRISFSFTREKRKSICFLRRLQRT